MKPRNRGGLMFYKGHPKLNPRRRQKVTKKVARKQKKDLRKSFTRASRFNTWKSRHKYGYWS